MSYIIKAESGQSLWYYCQLPLLSVPMLIGTSGFKQKLVFVAFLRYHTLHKPCLLNTEENQHSFKMANCQAFMPSHNHLALYDLWWHSEVGCCWVKYLFYRLTCKMSPSFPKGKEIQTQHTYKHFPGHWYHDQDCLQPSHCIVLYLSCVIWVFVIGSAMLTIPGLLFALAPYGTPQRKCHMICTGRPGWVYLVYTA